MKYTRVEIIRTFLKDNRSLVLGAMISALICSVINVLLPVSIGKYFDLLLHDSTAKGLLIERTGLHIQDFRSFFILFFTLISLRAVLAYCETFLTDLTEERFTKFVRQELFKSQMSQSYQSFKSNAVSKYLLRYSSDSAAIRNYLSKGILKLIADVCFLLVAFWMLFTMNAALTFILAGSVLASGILMIFLSRLPAAKNKLRQDSRSKFLQHIESRLQSFLTIKAFNRESPEINRFNRRNEQLYEASRSYFRLQAVAQSMLPFLFFASIGLILYASMPSGSEPVPGSEGHLLVFILIMLYLQGVFKRMMRVPSIIIQGKTSFDNLLSILNLPSEYEGAAMDLEEKTNGRVKIKDLSYSYSADMRLINHFNAEFAPGSFSCVAGEHASGKTTLSLLLAGLIRPTEGSIQLDDMRYQDLNPSDLRRNIVLVSEELPLIGDTVFKAVSYSRKPEKREAAIKMLKALEIAFDADPEANLDHYIGQGGQLISSGDRRMLQYARALLTRKKVIILDDPFTNLDKKNKDIIVRTLNDLREKRTIIALCSDVPEGPIFDQIIRL